ncbi:MAG: 1-acyl-sn-glycerol-3-phosphate acyltransferase [Sphaerochaetaceae bacterium]|jgi:1-acyl-sn-glycerol-3-phosphate acyltransferase|nr:1-acyl-sn-glycerol-3-phosphate acyltransferase [Sphaerochaetaceae bacterium]MDD3941777.1 1-acyl-sn-glycerol-3-phosphate acyltransferase [Sphaerochaetaceae bacterium]MDX9939051.1 1-acyl-sn-glycerol-3-phosphate acyltransferase [Sphaerochaetaceae bacterium]
MDKSKYWDIAPYEGQDVLDAVARIKAYPKFLSNMAEVLYAGNIIKTKWKSHQMKEMIPPLLDQVKSYDDFQKLITAGVFLPTIERNSMTSFTFSGQENLDPDTPYLFISNHRDIVLDCALLDYALMQSGMPFCEMAIGDNLLVNQFTTDMFKLNGGVTVKRELPMREQYQESMRLSRYFVELITEEKKSIWVAQRSGRSKDGIDKTNPAIIKMLYLSFKSSGISFQDLIKACHIVPVAISYQYDPNDINKGREEVSKKLHGTYTKKRYEDLVNMLRGLRRFKGDVHIRFGKPLADTYANADEVAFEIDRQIHIAYKLWDTNYFAYDLLQGPTRFTDRYAGLNTKKFLDRYKDLSEDLRHTILRSYANPVMMQLEALGM